MPVRVAVIGAGAAGLCCARLLASRPDYFTLKIFEKAAVVGGTWVYEESGNNEDGMHSSVYKNLRLAFRVVWHAWLWHVAT